ncbi:hypothetical protein ERO13_D11G149600v2 [Gossypium hirsutum]|uniref:Uncharacterized protein n=2 Tax=Gossypium TaxID=3633 RepID=A0A5J5PDT6_GOSBA|nr:hypothetical protein ES319_D11G156800v1 [Gossypium barbadense]KAG4120540.1 hypothetical protein ERO13_D11G149600v2 [Gossypium hirsutum]TYI55720.1 hypothetical protein E1A91_D11G160400v1 [Gossypium mustelinum]
MLFVSKNLHDFKASQLIGWVADRIDPVNQIMEKYLRYVNSASITHLNLIFFLLVFQALFLLAYSFSFPSYFLNFLLKRKMVANALCER